jgi:large subunit ribosomal protein L24e
VKHQRGIVGADLSSILAKRNQKPEVRDAQRYVLATSLPDDAKTETERRWKGRLSSKL